MAVLQESCSPVPASEATVKMGLCASTGLGLRLVLCHHCRAVHVLCFFCPIKVQKLQLSVALQVRRTFLLSGAEWIFFKVLLLVPTQILVHSKVGTNVKG